MSVHHGGTDRIWCKLEQGNCYITAAVRMTDRHRPNMHTIYICIHKNIYTHTTVHISIHNMHVYSALANAQQSKSTW